MPFRVLIIPDKFKGTLTAQSAAAAIAAGWRKTRPMDQLELLPMSDGGDGFGDILSRLLGARTQFTKTVDAAHRPIRARWWLERKTKTAIIETAGIIGLAQLPPKKFHPFQLDTFGLGKVLQAALRRGAKRCIMGIGGSATNDAGFGMARALGWRFLDPSGREIREWWQLLHLSRIVPPRGGSGLSAMKITVAVDVRNPLLGRHGCSKVYGPQKGLREDDFPVAEKCLRVLATVWKKQFRKGSSTFPGAGAAGGLGFGLVAFANAQPASGFHMFVKYADLTRRLAAADLVVTGEGAIDRSTLMGKGVGELASLCKTVGVRCIGLAGVVAEPDRARRFFDQTRGLTEITTAENAKRRPAFWLTQLAASLAADLRDI